MLKVNEPIIFIKINGKFKNSMKQYFVSLVSCESDNTV